MTAWPDAPARRAVAFSECDAAGRPVAGTARLAMPWLEQDEYWTTAAGEVLRLEDMTASHRANLLAWLRRHAARLMLQHDLQLATGPLAPRGEMATLDFDLMLDAEADRDPVDRIAETALYQRLAALTARDDEEPY